MIPQKAWTKVDQECRVLRYYRGHVIVVLVDSLISAEVTDLSTGIPFPLKVTATQIEGEAVLLTRAYKLIDLTFTPAPKRILGASEDD